jgi:hypothetical protein
MLSGGKRRPDFSIGKKPRKEDEEVLFRLMADGGLKTQQSFHYLRDNDHQKELFEKNRAIFSTCLYKLAEKIRLP